MVAQFGLATFHVSGKSLINSGRTALEVSYRAVDTAQIYVNTAKVAALWN